MMRAVTTLACVFGLISSATAAEFTRGIRDVTTIQDEAGAGRLLFMADLPSDLGPVAVKQATLTIPVTAVRAEVQGEAGTLDLRVYPVATAWNAGSVTWTSGWRQPGGDYEDGLYGHADVDLTADGQAQFDVTAILKEILEEGLPVHGFMLTVSPEAAIGIRSEDREAFPNLASASLEVRYRTTPPRPARVAQ